MDIQKIFHLIEEKEGDRWGKEDRSLDGAACLSGSAGGGTDFRRRRGENQAKTRDFLDMARSFRDA